MWKGGENTELVDSTLADSWPSSEVLRYVQLGLLCVQERAEDRPPMSDVVSMIHNETMTLPDPKEPSLLSYVSSTTEGDSSKIKQAERSHSVHESVVSVVYPR